MYRLAVIKYTSCKILQKLSRYHTSTSLICYNSSAFTLTSALKCVTFMSTLYFVRQLFIIITDILIIIIIINNVNCIEPLELSTILNTHYDLFSSLVKGLKLMCCISVKSTFAKWTYTYAV